MKPKYQQRLDAIENDDLRELRIESIENLERYIAETEKRFSERLLLEEDLIFNSKDLKIVDVRLRDILDMIK